MPIEHLNPAIPVSQDLNEYCIILVRPIPFKARRSTGEVEVYEAGLMILRSRKMAYNA